MPLSESQAREAAILMILLAEGDVARLPETALSALRSLAASNDAEIYDTVMQLDEEYPDAAIGDAWIDAESAYLERSRGGEQATPPVDTTVDDRRYVNLCFAWPYSLTPCPGDLQLATDVEYQLRLDIGELSDLSILRDDHPFNTRLLPRTDDGHWLTVAVTSSDFTTPGRSFPLFLPKNGRSWACGCPPGGTHGCTPQRRSDHLYIAVSTPSEPGPALLGIGIYAGRRLVQHITVTAQIEVAESLGVPQRAITDFTLTAQLSDLGKHDRLAAPALSIGVSPATSNCSDILLAGTDRPLVLNMTEHQMQSLLNRGRDLLLAAHKAASIRKNLDRLAIFGREALIALADQGSTRKLLRERLSSPSVIQVAQIGAANITLPWALFYDIPIQTGSTASHRTCPVVDELAALAAGARTCPYEQSHSTGTICPFGFWGYRHFIELPATAPNGIPLRINTSSKSRMVAGYGDILHSTRHLDSLAAAMPDVTISPHRHRTALMDAICSDDLSMLYCFCHCHTTKPGDGGSSYLDFGGRDNRLTPGDLASYEPDDLPYWKRNAPLVFINGCETGSTRMDSWLGFVRAFGSMQASGVIGTEIPVRSGAASAIANEFWTHLGTRHTVGESLHAARIRLLRTGDLVGLGYTAYCSAHLRLAPSGGASTAEGEQ